MSRILFLDKSPGKGIRPPHDSSVALFEGDVSWGGLSDPAKDFDGIPK